MSEGMPFKVRFLPDGKEILSFAPKTAFELSMEASVKLGSNCGGRGKCGQCRIIIKEPKGVSNVSKLEEQFLGPLKDKSYRLACQTIVNGDTNIFIPKETNECDFQIKKETKFKIKCLPCISTFELKIDSTCMDDLLSKEDILKKCLETRSKHAHLPIELLKKMPPLFEIKDNIVSAIIRRDGKILDFSKNKIEHAYGIAFDIGTTTVGAYLWEIKEGRFITSLGALNPQRSYGQDVISRISYSIESPEGLSILRNSILNTMNHMIERLCAKERISKDMIFEAVVVGNTVMHHIFLGLPLKDISVAPYRPVVAKGLDLPAVSLGLSLADTGYVILPPPKAGFLGPDTLAAVIGTGIHKKDKYVLLMDLGTNAEIVLGNKSKILCTSAAASPAFEAAHIGCGMAALPGAIERVQVGYKGKQLGIKTVGDQAPKGICGSGVISLLAGLLREGCLTKTGRLSNRLSKERLMETYKGLGYVLAQGKETATGSEIVITEKDIAELQVAKAAIRAGIQILWERLGLPTVEEIIITGAFGSSLEPDDLVEIGLIPPAITGKIRVIENAAGIGASMVLVNWRKRKEIFHVISQMEYIDLAQQHEFKDLFVEALAFGRY